VTLYLWAPGNTRSWRKEDFAVSLAKSTAITEIAEAMLT
jgi:hypothetical protein